MLFSEKPAESKMPQFLKKIRRETIFTIIGALFAIIIVTVAVYVINFLASEVKISLEETGVGKQGIIRFNLEGLKALGLIKDKEQPIQTSTTTEAGTTTGQVATTTESATTSNPKR